ncbi:hypothetical protein CH370_09730 [Leptospira kmetyi]|nr:hypothetical protein CH370_09730 [Leptospira kmetyi]
MGALRVSFICNDRLEMVQDVRGNGRLTDASRAARNRGAILAPGSTTSLRSTKLKSKKRSILVRSVSRPFGISDVGKLCR